MFLPLSVATFREDSDRNMYECLVFNTQYNLLVMNLFNFIKCQEDLQC